MAQRKKSEIEFIQDTFCPQIAVLCSYDAELICRKNFLTFVELVQPFCRFNGEIKIFDPSNNACTISNLRVEIKDMNHVPLLPQTYKRIFDDSVQHALNSANSLNEKQITTSNYQFSANLNTPWFESWRESFIKIGSPEDHEFLKHFLSCIFVVSTSHLDPLDQFQKLLLEQQQIQANTANRLPKWFFSHSNNIYKYFVLLHDAQVGELSKAHQIFEALKNTYGSHNCHLLQINSKNLQQQSTNVDSSAQNQNDFDPWLQYVKFNEAYQNSNNMHSNPSTVSLNSLQLSTNAFAEENGKTEGQTAHPLDNNLEETELELSKLSLKAELNQVKKHGLYLSSSDHDRIKTFMSEFLQRGLVPYAERTVKVLNEQIQSKKSILKSFSIPRKLFGGSSSSTSSSSPTISLSSASKSASIMTNASNANTSASATNSSLNNSSITITNNFIASSNDDLQIRRLADLAFMFRMYDLAYNSYHSAKKEFSNILAASNSASTNSDQILHMKMYLAGALEMATISSFMQSFANDLALINQNSLPVSASTNSLSALGFGYASTTHKSYSSQYIDEAINIYLNECKNMYFSVRAVLLSTEALRVTNMNLKAAYQFINLSNDETDVRTALFLEQAALCYLAQSPSLVKKYAFYMSLAGHRFNKSGQKRHSLRVYKQALEIYENKNWFRAQDYVNYLMSQLNFKLKNIKQALENVENILYKKTIPKANSLSASDQKHDYHHHHHHQHQHHGHRSKTNQPVTIELANEANILKDFINYSNLLNKNLSEQKEHQKSLPIISIPQIDHNNIKISLNSFVDSDLKFGSLLINDDSFLDKNETNSSLKSMWESFEEGLYLSAFNTPVPILFKPQITLYDKHTDNKQMPKVVVNEAVTIYIDLKNTLKTSFLLKNVTLLWKSIDQAHLDEKNFAISNELSPNEQELDDHAECSSIDELKLFSNESTQIKLCIKPKRVGCHLHVLGMRYEFVVMENQTGDLAEKIKSDFLLGKQLFDIQGVRLSNNQQNMRSIVYDVDNRLNFKIINKTALLQIEIDHLPQTMICNQFKKVKFYFVNKSEDLPIGNIKIASNALQKSLITFDDPKSNCSNTVFDTNDELRISKSEFKFKEDAQTSSNDEQQILSNKNNSNNKTYDFIYSLENVIVKPNEAYELHMWMRAPESCGEHKFYFMFFYEDFGQKSLANRKEQSRTRSGSVSHSHGLKYRVVRHEFTLNTAPCLTVTNSKLQTSQSNMNAFVNLELTNRQTHTSFELLNLISISDLWSSSPLQHTESVLIKSLSSARKILNSHVESSDSLFKMNKIVKNLEETVSLVLRARPAYEANGQTINLLRSSFKSEHDFDALSLSEKVLLNFIRNEIKKELLTKSNKDNYLSLCFLWRSKTTLANSDTNEKENNAYAYGMLPLSINLERDANRAQDLFGLAKNPILVNIMHEQFLKREPLNSSFSCICVNIVLKNLSPSSEFEMAIIAKNLRNSDTDRKYLWLGSNKKLMRLKCQQTKQVRFKLGFVSNGIFEIGQLSNDTILKMNLIDATSLSSLENDFIADNNNATNSNTAANVSLNASCISNSSINLTQLDALSMISVYVKNNKNETYELFQRLKPFTVGIL